MILWGSGGNGTSPYIFNATNLERVLRVDGTAYGRGIFLVGLWTEGTKGAAVDVDWGLEGAGFKLSNVKWEKTVRFHL